MFCVVFNSRDRDGRGRLTECCKKEVFFGRSVLAHERSDADVDVEIYRHVDLRFTNCAASEEMADGTLAMPFKRKPICIQWKGAVEEGGAS